MIGRFREADTGFPAAGKKTEHLLSLPKGTEVEVRAPVSRIYDEDYDYLFDLGPEGGHKGGELIACGTPEEIAACRESHTGRFLAEYL